MSSPVDKYADMENEIKPDTDTGKHIKGVGGIVMADKCPTCKSDDPDYSPDGDSYAACYCTDSWHSQAGQSPAPHDFRNCPAMRALEQLTPGGSEYIDDIQRCVATVRESYSTPMRLLVESKSRVRALEEALRQLLPFVKALAASGEGAGIHIGKNCPTCTVIANAEATLTPPKRTTQEKK